jgi:hypothetical protein
LEGLADIWGPQILIKTIVSGSGLGSYAFFLVDIDTILLTSRDPNLEIRTALAEEAWHHLPRGKEGFWDAIPDLIKILEEEPNKDVRRYLIYLLEEHTGQDIGGDIDAWKTW